MEKPETEGEGQHESVVADGHLPHRLMIAIGATAFYTALKG
jgi:hypothetical protein